MEPIAEPKKTNWIKIIDLACRISSCVILIVMAVLLIVSKTPAGNHE